MKSLNALCLLLVTACAVPVQDSIGRPATADRVLVLPPPSSTQIRVGLESLPPTASPLGAGGLTPPATTLLDAERLPDETGVALTAIEPWRPAPEAPAAVEGLQDRWALKRTEIRAKRNTVERVTLRFLSELIGDDRKRVQRAIGTPLLGSQIRLHSDPLSNFLDERDRVDRQNRLTENGTRMIRRPLRNALKELPLFNDVEFAIKEFKDANVTYARKRGGGLGRLSARVRAGRPENPLELVWIRRGLRMSSSLQHLKASFTTELLPELHLRIRSRYNYETTNWRLFGSVEYQVNDFTTFQALAGNNINILAGPAGYPGGPQSDETSTGVLLFVEHQF